MQTSCGIFYIPEYGADLRVYRESAGKSGRKKMFDPYSVLGVSRDASDDEIKKAKILQSCTANGGVYSEENVEFTT